MRRLHAALLIAAIVLAWLASGFLLRWIFGKDAGTVGDSFGAVSALFSGLAFFGVIYAILLQRQELELQRDEIRENRREMERSREALLEQARIMAQQTTATEESKRETKASHQRSHGHWSRTGS